MTGRCIAAIARGHAFGSRSLAWTLLAGLVVSGCKGSAGPEGPVGPRGDPGNPGTSVTVAPLGSGTACAYGGSQLSDGTTTSVACSGAPAAHIEVVAADDVSLGPAYWIAEAPSLTTGVTRVLLAEQPGGPGTRKVLVWRSLATGEVAPESLCTSLDTPLYFTQPNCVGPAYTNVGAWTPWMPCVGSVRPSDPPTRVLMPGSVAVSLDLYSFGFTNAVSCLNYLPGPAYGRVLPLTDLGPVAAAPQAPLALRPAQ